jgi:hypothetical protein
LILCKEYYFIIFFIKSTLCPDLLNKYSFI